MEGTKKTAGTGNTLPGATPVAARQTPVLTEEDAGFRTLFLQNPQPMWVFDLQTLQFLEVNEAAIALYGYSREEFLGMLLSDVRPQEDVPRFLQEVALARQGGQYRGEWRHRFKDNRLMDVEIHSRNVTFRGQEA